MRELKLKKDLTIKEYALISAKLSHLQDECKKKHARYFLLDNEPKDIKWIMATVDEFEQILNADYKKKYKEYLDKIEFLAERKKNGELDKELWKEFRQNYNSFLNKTEKWIQDLQNKCAEEVKAARNDKYRDFREKQIVGNAGSGIIEVPNDDTSTKTEEMHIEGLTHDEK